MCVWVSAQVTEPPLTRTQPPGRRVEVTSVVGAGTPSAPANFSLSLRVPLPFMTTVGVAGVSAVAVVTTAPQVGTDWL